MAFVHTMRVHVHVYANSKLAASIHILKYKLYTFCQNILLLHIVLSLFTHQRQKIQICCMHIFLNKQYSQISSVEPLIYLLPVIDVNIFTQYLKFPPE